MYYLVHDTHKCAYNANIVAHCSFKFMYVFYTNNLVPCNVHICMYVQCNVIPLTERTAAVSSVNNVVTTLEQVYHHVPM